MRKFQFRLEPVLQVRKRAEEDAAREVARIRSELNATRGILERSRGERLAFDLETIRASENGLSAEKLLERRAVSEMLHLQIEMAAHREEQLQEDLVRQEAFWNQKHRESRTVETIQEKQIKRWQQEHQREEQNLLDEMATLGYARRAGERGGILNILLPIMATFLFAGLVLAGIYMANSRQKSFLDPERLGGGLRSERENPVAAAEEIRNATEANPAPLSSEDLGGEGLMVNTAELGRTIQRIEEQRDRLAKREQELAAREERLRLAERDLDERRGQLETVRDQVAEFRAEIREISQYIDSTEERRRQEHVQRMVRVYEGMNPRDAASLILELDPNLAKRIISDMNPRKSVRLISALGDLNAPAANRLIEQMTQDARRVEVGS